MPSLQFFITEPEAHLSTRRELSAVETGGFFFFNSLFNVKESSTKTQSILIVIPGWVFVVVLRGNARQGFIGTDDGAVMRVEEKRRNTKRTLMINSW